MPLYELLCLAKPALARPDLVRMMQRVGDVVYNNGGIVTDLKNYGPQELAYDIRRPFQRYDQAHIWQLNFAAKPESLEDLKHVLKVNEHVLRWVVVKKPMFKYSLQELMQRAEHNKGGADRATESQ